MGGALSCIVPAPIMYESTIGGGYKYSAGHLCTLYFTILFIHYWNPVIGSYKMNIADIISKKSNTISRGICNLNC